MTRERLAVSRKPVGVTRRQFLGVSLAGLGAAGLVACGYTGDAGSSTAGSTSTPEATRTPVFSPEPSATPPFTLPSRNYPANDANFVLGTGGLEDAEERLRELGAGGDINLMQQLIVNEMNREGIRPSSTEWVFALYEAYPNSSWTMMAQDRQTREFYWPRITVGPERNQLVRSGNLFQYLSQNRPDGDFFDLERTPSPLGLGVTEQSLIVDETGWFVAVVRSRISGQPYFWYNAEEERWDPLSSFLPDGATTVENRNGMWTALGPSNQEIARFNSSRREWEPLSQVGIIGQWYINSPENIQRRFPEPAESSYDRYRFRNGAGNYVPYGYWGEISSDGRIYRTYIHLRYRALLDSPTNLGIPYPADQRLVLFDIPYSYNSESPGASGEPPRIQQFAVANYLLYDDTVRVSLLDNANIESRRQVARSYRATYEMMRNVPPGASIILGLGDTSTGYFKDNIYDSIRDEQIINDGNSLPIFDEIIISSSFA